MLVTTNAANVGINKASIALQIQFNWPCNLPTYFQEQGRGSQQKGIASTCILYADLSLYVFLVLQQLNRHTDNAVDAGSTAECNGYNSAILPRWQQRQVNTSNVDFALGPAGRKQLCARMLSELQEVLRFFCLNLGCQHVCGKMYLLTGILDYLLATGTCNSCPICNRLWHKDFLLVFRCSVIAFIEWLMATAKLPFAVDYKLQLSLLLMASTYWKKIIFDKSASSVS